VGNNHGVHRYGAADQLGRFDRIVLGQLAPAKWMAGNGRRTPREQEAHATETAETKTIVQLAVVRRGDDRAIRLCALRLMVHPQEKPRLLRGFREFRVAS
jgi:hypothetical protein